MAPPTAWVRSEVADRRWTLRATSWRHHVELYGDGSHREPHVLPVPLPALGRNAATDFEHLAGQLRCVVREFGRIIFEGQSELAGLEVGSLPATR
jgi:tocopherol cyclase